MRFCIVDARSVSNYDELLTPVAKMIPYMAYYLLSVQSARDKVYRLTPLGSYSFGKRLAIRVAGLLFYVLIKIVGSTIRFEIEGEEHLASIESIEKLPIYAIWHDRIFAGTYYLRNSGIAFLTSQSFDGEYIARFLRRFGYGVIRGSSTRGGSRGLVEMIRGMKRGLAMGFTVDGPKGPRYEAKPGPILLAKKTGNPILPFILESSKYWTVNSWDRLQIPLPFTRTLMIYGKPIYVSNTASESELNEKLDELQHSLDLLVERGRKWRQEK
jgi:lysophospholipid acyltransferase (LPLAT)-like uncharacterized protein